MIHKAAYGSGNAGAGAERELLLPATAELQVPDVTADPAVASACWTCGDRPPHRFRYLIHAAGRLRWAVTTARHAKPKTVTARLRLLWHDFVIHGLLHRGTERCQDCGRDYPAWRADDIDWRRVMGGASGLLCAACFGGPAR